MLDLLNNLRRWGQVVALFFLSTTSAQGQTIADIEHSLDSIFQSAGHNEIYNLLKLIKWDSELTKQIPCIPPVEPQSLSNIKTSSNFGFRLHPITQKSHQHSGIDLPLHTANDTIYAPGNGVVDTIGFNQNLGVYIRIKHHYNYETIYGHLDKLLCMPKQVVTLGTPIAIMGSTGRSTGKHLHYTIKHNNQYIPPLPYCYLMLDVMLNIKSNGD